MAHTPISTPKHGTYLDDRWDPIFYDPKLLEIIKFVRKQKDKNKNIISVKQLGEYQPFIRYGVIVTGRQRFFSKQGIRYISSITVRSFGIVHSKSPLFVPVKDKRNVDDRKPQKGDILFCRSGEGTIGRNCVFLFESGDDWTISDDVNIIRVAGISSCWTSLFLNCHFGERQIFRHINGVSGQLKISFDKIKEIWIPKPIEAIEKQVDKEYSKIFDLQQKLSPKGQLSEENEAILEREYQKLLTQVEAILEGRQDKINPL